MGLKRTNFSGNVLPHARHVRARRGVALLMVVAVVAIASVLGWAMLSSAALQNRAGANQARLLSADYLAESGINLALYYLQQADATNPTGYWTGTGYDLPIDTVNGGTVHVTVTRDASDPWAYEVVSTGRAGINADTQVTKTTGARIYVRSEYKVSTAAAFNAHTTVVPNFTFQGDVWSSRNLGVRLGGIVTGSAYCKVPITGAGYGTPLGGFKSLSLVNTSNPAPSADDLNLYENYWHNDVKRQRAALNSSTLAGVTLNPTTENPAGIYYRNPGATPFTITGGTIINGTLIVQGDLQILGNVIINAQTNYPALIVTGSLELQHPSNSLTVNGICYVGNQIRSSGTLPALPVNYTRMTIDGALLVGNTGATSPLVTGYNVPTTVKYNAAKAKAGEMTWTQRVPKGVSIVRWGLP